LKGFVLESGRSEKAIPNQAFGHRPGLKSAPVRVKGASRWTGKAINLITSNDLQADQTGKVNGVYVAKAVGCILLVIGTIVNTYVIYGDRTRFKNKYLMIALLIILDLLLIVGAIYLLSSPMI
jgi:hypothetical protein